VVFVLQCYWFPPSYVKWVSSCLSSVCFTIFFNDKGDGLIQPVRQGCVMSPYLFNLCMDILARMLEYNVQLGSIKGVQLTRGAPCLTNLMFADYLIILGKG
jgi:Reverse transcriptase (RNA-dependent DNA polymerase)